jgi:uncharacterized protein (TIGR03435 family)
MKMLRRISSSCEIVALCLSGLAFAPDSAAQTQKAAPLVLKFEIVSLKHVGNYQNGGRSVGSTHYGRTRRPVQYTGTKLSGEVPLNVILRFAFSSLVSPYYCEAPQWLNEEYYQIDAITPAGTTEDNARAMLRTALADRIGLQYHLAEREKKILALLRGSGALKLTPSTEAEPNPGIHQLGVFRNKSASLADFAGFLSALAGSQVVDKTGIQGLYKFDVDWSNEIISEGQSGKWDPREGVPGLAQAEVKKLGLRLESGKDSQKTLVVDRANREPTPN